MKPDFEKWCKVKYDNNPLILNDISANVIILNTEDLNQFAEDYAKQEAIEFGMFMKFDSEKYKDEYRLAYQKNQTDLGFTEYCYQKYKDEQDNKN